MPRISKFDTAFVDLRREFRATAKRKFLDDLKAQIDDDEEIASLIKNYRYDHRYVAVSFDRRLNDAAFSYAHFDILLVLIDAYCGGSGIYKPVNQLRVLRWNGTLAALKKVLNYFRKTNADMNFYRLLILPYKFPPVGRNILPSIYRK